MSETGRPRVRQPVPNHTATPELMPRGTKDLLERMLNWNGDKFGASGAMAFLAFRQEIALLLARSTN